MPGGTATPRPIAAMKMICLYFCLSQLTVQSLFLAQDTMRSDEGQAIMCEVSRFRELRATTDLPPAVFSLCADRYGKLAEPGKKWEATDNLGGHNLPAQRLVWAVTDGTYYFVHYECGGRGHSYHVLAAMLSADESQPSKVLRFSGRLLKDFKAYLVALVNGNLREDPDGGN